MVRRLIPSTELLGLLSTAVGTPGVRGATAVVKASEAAVFLLRQTSVAELLEIYDRRLRMGRLDSVAGGRELVDALRSLQDTEVLMVVVKSSAGAASVWVAVDVHSLVGAIAFPASPHQDAE